jgi:pimeloyl-ACP methyl ester carboxylesterase
VSRTGRHRTRRAGARASRPSPAGRRLALRGGTVTVALREAGRGPALLYLHSAHERGGWSPFLDRLARRCRVLAPLHPGVGASTGVETLEDLLDLTLVYDELLTALGLRAAHLVGHAFGAMVAAELAAVFPQRARSLTLLAPLGLWRDDVPLADDLILPAEELRGALWADPDGSAARAWAAPPATEAERVAAELESLQARAAVARFTWPIPHKGIERRLHRVRAPALLVWGVADRVVPLAYAAEWQRRLAAARLVRLAGGHLVHHEAPGPAARVVAAFVARHDGAGHRRRPGRAPRPGQAPTGGGARVRPRARALARSRVQSGPGHRGMASA